MIYKVFFKRVFDFILSLLAIIVLSIFLIIIAILVRIKLGSPIIFKQVRPGKNNKLFTIYKFRTMTNEKDNNGILLSDDKRLTKFGSFLRESSLDELPELFNILIGDMAIVGPRPLLVKDMVFFDEEIMKRQSIRPGLTGLAQVNGRNNISWEDKFKYDLEYVNHKTLFFLDISLIIKTFLKAIIKHDNINTDGLATAEDYGDYLLRNGKISFIEFKEKLKNTKEIIKEKYLWK